MCSISWKNNFERHNLVLFKKRKKQLSQNLNISVKQNSTCQYLRKHYNISTTCYYKAEGISSTKQVVFFHLVRPCDNNCKNEEINSFQPHLKRKWVCFPAEKADMFSSPRQIVYTSSQLKILIFDKEINNFEEHLHAKSKHIGIQKKEMYRWYPWRHPLLFALAMCQRGFLCSVVDKWNVTSMFVNKYLPCG